jgi:hypothetical protein
VSAMQARLWSGDARLASIGTRRPNGLANQPTTILSLGGDDWGCVVGRWAQLRTGKSPPPNRSAA